MLYCQSKSQKASALLTALFVTMIAAILSIAILSRVSILIHLSTLSNTSDQAMLYLQGIDAQFNGDILRYANAWKNTQKGIPQKLARRIGPQTFMGMTLYGTLTDAQSRFNINSLVSPNNQAKFDRLAMSLLPNMPKAAVTQLAQSITDWLTRNTLSDQIYGRFTPPYRAAHQPMVDISELQLIDGMTPLIYSKLQPYLTALPNSNTTDIPVNINTATAVVLLTLSPKIDLQKANALIACQKEHGEFLTQDAYNKTCVQPLGLSPLNGITTHSQFFIIQTSATNQDQQVFTRRLVMVLPDLKNHFYTQVVWQQHL